MTKNDFPTAAKRRRLFAQARLGVLPACEHGVDVNREPCPQCVALNELSRPAVAECPTHGVCPPCREGWGHWNGGEYVPTVQSRTGLTSHRLNGGSR